MAVIWESVAFIFFGLLFSISFNWQFTIIVFIPFAVYIIISVLHVRMEMLHSLRSMPLRKQANTVGRK